MRQANHALTYRDFGKDYRYGTLRNEMKKHIDTEKVLKLPKECPTRFVLADWASRPEYACVLRNDMRGTTAKLDVLSYLKSLTWEDGLKVHNLKFSFLVYNFHWRGEGWTYHKRSHSYSRHFKLSYPVFVEIFDTGVVLLCVKCSCKPFPLDFEGLSSLLSLLGEARHALHSECIPETLTWLIVQWHLNRDSEQIAGPDFFISFRDLFDEVAQIYYKHQLGKIRVEANQSPKQTIQDVFEEILNRDNSLEGDH